ncbi:class IV adenylate cyclase [Myroides pelagicus]|uniref:CYTH domain-containing protein n=1 Tax=Myroides pelagicus TaxID=270914 RepID=A0A7K1GH89_9FLAO|nr:class IV adenylate cyclase [Myroides pelagicus]MEC4113476.1 class IV adenylate cyclase [Myroides pelagicus]MTH28316.1 CYTH domain-containing protein [Myroides pelagicus]
MELKNIEFKASVDSILPLEDKLKRAQVTLEGIYTQVDTYYNVPIGRVKLREYGDYSSLIYYHRENQAGAKQSDVIYYKHEPNTALVAILEMQFGIKVKVAKTRKVYKPEENISIHLDEVDGLGSFIEVEACNAGNDKTPEELQAQCDYYFQYFHLRTDQLIDQSYSDLKLAKAK